MSDLAVDCAALSRKADELLERHHQKFFALGLYPSFNQSTLATKYWLPLPEPREPPHWLAIHDDVYPPIGGGPTLALALAQCRNHLDAFEAAVERGDNLYAIRWSCSELYIC